MNGLDLGCGTGEVALQLKQIVGDEGHITGIDRNSTNINIANEKMRRQKSSPVIFCKTNILEWQEEQCYDFVYNRLLLNHIGQPRMILQKIYNSLISEGMAITEDLDFSNYHCFPNCYAFDRYVELYIEMKKRQGTDANIGNQLYTFSGRLVFWM